MPYGRKKRRKPQDFKSHNEVRVPTWPPSPDDARLINDAKLERQRLVAEAGGGPFYSCYHGVVWHREGSQWVGVVNYHVGKKRAKQVKIYSDDHGEVFSLMQAHKCAAAVDSFIEKQKGWEGLYNLNKDQDFDMKATTLLCEKPKMKVFKKI